MSGQNTRTQEEELVRHLTAVRPSGRQLQHQQMEFYGFIHFTVNTFTGKEWGDGTEDPSVFAPTALDAGQWARTAKAAGMTGLILTCKHHDGFCLWPSRYTKHSVAASPYQNGEGDVVLETAQACREYGLKFGIYLSPWDRNSSLYGQGEAYNDYFVAQLEELLTEYGEIFTVWFDGACGEGANGRIQNYDWQRYYDTIRRLQPGACIAVCGPDVRWCGNEAGDTRPSEWSVVPRRLSWAETVEGKSQNRDDAAFRQQGLKSQDLDLGSRGVLEKETDLIWYPAEVNTSIRPGWFYHPEEDSQVCTLARLQELYLKAVGGNATLLLNLPPDKRGLLAKPDVAVMEAFGEWKRNSFREDLALEAELQQEKEGLQPLWQQRLCWKKPRRIAYVVLQEDIAQSQRVERYLVQLLDAKGRLQFSYEGSVIGYQKIVPVTSAPQAEGAAWSLPDGVWANEVRVKVLESRGAVCWKHTGVFEKK